MSEISKLVFEVSWEVVNKVGGIHTVVRTKAEESVSELENSYYMIGPFNAHEAITEVERNTKISPDIEDSLNSMREHGIKVWTGTWSIPGNPTVILFDIQSGYKMLEGWRFEFNRTTGIPIHVFDLEINEAIIFGGMVSWFLGDLKNRLGYNTIIIAHFHEWNSSIGLIYLRDRNIDVSLIFTTHATLMGRHLAAGKCDLYNNLNDYNCDFEAGKRGFYSNYCIERCAAHKAHVFTSVSQITGDEAAAFLGRTPDIITPNGLSVKKFASYHDFNNSHVVCKGIINEFVRGHFFGSYYFDLEKTLYFFNAGRYEFSNKGVDILLEAAYRLNNILKATEADVTVVLFLIFNANTNNFNVESLKNQAIVRQLRQAVSSIQEAIGKRIFESVMCGKIPDKNELLDRKEITQLKKFIHTRRNVSGLPPVVTHNMLDDENDPILCTLRRLRLFNHMDDKVKIVFHPHFLSSTSPLFPIDYESFVKGCNLGIFPSYYEPWGYTPAECINCGIPSMTTNLSGFGQFMEERMHNPTDYGIYVIDRKTRSIEESINQMTNHMYDFVNQSRKERIIQRNRCERLCELLDWKRLNFYYSKARIMALERTHPDKLRCFRQPIETPIFLQKVTRSASFTSPPSSQKESNHEDNLINLCSELRISKNKKCSKN